MADYPLIGEDAPVSVVAYELRISDHLCDIQPASFGITDVPTLDPAGYFITSGDAVAKATKLEDDLWILAGQLRAQRPKKPSKKYVAYERAVWQCAGKARVMLNKLIKARGAHCFLETEWKDSSRGIAEGGNGRALIVVGKDPRSKLPIEAID